MALQIRRAPRGAGLLTTLATAVAAASWMTPAYAAQPGVVPLASQADARYLPDPTRNVVDTANVGDVNGDGFDDLAISTDLKGTSEDPRVHVVYGGPTPTSVDLAAPLGASGFTITATPEEREMLRTGSGGFELYGGHAGDLNGDGTDDLLLRAPNAGACPLPTTGASCTGRRLTAGAIIVYEGRAGGGDLPDRNVQQSYADPDAMVIIGGLVDRLNAASSVGDVNGDGLDDLAIGASAFQYTGSAGGFNGRGAVVYGRAAADPANLDLEQLQTGGTQQDRALVVHGDISGSETFASGVASAGDLNGDGLRDVFFGTEESAFPYSMVLYGQRSADPADLHLGDPGGLEDPSMPGVRGLRIDDMDGSKWRADATADFDFDGDGHDDLFGFTAEYDGSPVTGSGQTNKGAVVVAFGVGSADPADMDLATLVSAPNGRFPGGVVIAGFGTSNAGIGTSAPPAAQASVIGDTNGDGRGEVTFAAPRWVGETAGQTNAGRAYFVFGTDARTDIDLQHQACVGVGLIGEATGDQLRDAFSAGDHDGDGLADVSAFSLLHDGAGPDLGAGYLERGERTTAPALSATDITVDPEGDSSDVTPATFTLRLDRGHYLPVTVRYRTADRTATAGADYRPASGTVTFAPCQTEATVTADVVGDLVDEPDETFALELDVEGDRATGDTEAVATIIDDDDPVALALGEAEVTEGDLGDRPVGEVPVTLDAASGKTVEVCARRSGGSALADADHVSFTEICTTVPPGSTAGALDVTVIGDDVDEPDETVDLEVVRLEGGVLADGAGGVTILDDDDPVALDRDGSFLCRAAALRLGVLGIGLEPIASNRPLDPCVDDAEALLRPRLPLGALGSLGSVSADVLDTSTVAEPDDAGTTLPRDGDGAAAASRVAGLELKLLSLHLKARVVGTSATATCRSGKIVTSGEASVAELVINGKRTPVNAPLSLPIPLVGTLHVEHVSQRGSTTTARAIWLDVAPGLEKLVGDIVVAESVAGGAGRPCSTR